MSFMIDPSIHMFFVLFLTVGTMIMFVREKMPIEQVAIGMLAVLLLFGHVFPLYTFTGVGNALSAQKLLAGFANPSLYTILALMIIGKGMFQAQALAPVIRMFGGRKPKFAYASYVMILILVLVLSGFMNNTPLVILGIPVLLALAQAMKLPASQVMIPLSYASIFGGMTTLIGSSTNLLVSSSLVEAGEDPFTFFEFTEPAYMMAAVGMVYILFILPFFLPKRTEESDEQDRLLATYSAEFDVEPSNPLIGTDLHHRETISALGEGIQIRGAYRAGRLILPPFEHYTVHANDTLILSATRDELIDILGRFKGFVLSSNRHEKDQFLAKGVDEDLGSDHHLESRIVSEVMVPPNAPLLDRTLLQARLFETYGLVFLGIRTRPHMTRGRPQDQVLQENDVLLVLGAPSAINKLRASPDFVFVSGATQDLPNPRKKPLAIGIFAAAIASAATGLVPIAISAIIGAVLMLFTRCVTLRQATQAVDRRIFILIGSVLALGTAMQASGAAAAVADLITMVPFADDPFTVGALLFVIVAISTNLLTNNACGILYTPIAVSLANVVGIEPHIYAICVIFATDCSFATPIGYQTNLLVLREGGYQFVDFFRAGVPLIVLMFITFCALLKFYWGF